MNRLLKWSAYALISANLVGCAGKKILTITFPKKDGNSEYWVCDRTATNCHGKGDGDVDPMDYKPKMDSLSPPIECANGAAKMELVLKGNEVVQIGYECALPSAPTGLPGAQANSPSSPADGSNDSVPTGLPGAPTGLPDAPTGLPEEPTNEPESAADAAGADS